MAIEAGADALGFNFYADSKRFVALETERHWLEKVPDSVLRVAVVVNPTRDEAMRLLEEPFLDAIQLHGDETVDFAKALSSASEKMVIKALRVQNAESLRAVADFEEFPVLLDAFAGNERGGTGHTFDWNWIQAAPETERLLLSGGLTPENVATALRLTKLRYVDVASGVEENPRQKSAGEVRQFVAEVRKSAS